MISGDPYRFQDYANDFLQDLVDNPPNRPVIVYFDPDVDGLVAGKFYVEFLNDHDIDYETVMNPNRQHGFVLDKEQFRNRTVLSADFRVPAETFHELVNDYNVRYLCLDHHENDCGYQVAFDYDGSVKGVMINVLFGDEPQRDAEAYQSGAGVALDVLSHFYPDLNTRINRALVGVTLLTDVRPLDYPGARRFLDELYNIEVKDTFLEWLMKGVYQFSRDYGFGAPQFNRQFVDYKFGPYINSMLRLNQNQTAINYILGIQYPQTDLLSEQKTVVALAPSVVKAFHSENVVVQVYQYSKLPSKYADVWGNFLGYLANREKKATLAVLINDRGDVLKTSFRGRYSHVPYRETIQEMTGVECVGHAFAFGVKLKQFTPEFLQGLTKAVDRAEKSATNLELNVIEVPDLATWLGTGGMDIVKENDYKINEDKVYLRYTGPWRNEVSRKNYCTYATSGTHIIKGFDPSLTPENSIIEPSLDRGQLSLILTSEN